MTVERRSAPAGALMHRRYYVMGLWGVSMPPPPQPDVIDLCEYFTMQLEVSGCWASSRAEAMLSVARGRYVHRWLRVISRCCPRWFKSAHGNELCVPAPKESL